MFPGERSASSCPNSTGPDCGRCGVECNEPPDFSGQAENEELIVVDTSFPLFTREGTDPEQELRKINSAEKI